MGTTFQSEQVGGIITRFTTEISLIKFDYPFEHIGFHNILEPEFTIEVRLGQPLGVVLDSPDFVAENWHYYDLQNYSVFRRKISPKKMHTHFQDSIVLEKNGERGYIYLEDFSSPLEKQLVVRIPPYGLDELLAVHLLGMGRGIMLHSCAVRTHSNKGLLFAGLSGAGKSTSAKLWRESGKGVLIGDERVSVRKQNGLFCVLSTAWHGSGPATGPLSNTIDSLFILHHSNTFATR